LIPTWSIFNSYFSINEKIKNIEYCVLVFFTVSSEFLSSLLLLFFVIVEIILKTFKYVKIVALCLHGTLEARFHQNHPGSQKKSLLSKVPKVCTVPPGGPGASITNPVVRQLITPEKRTVKYDNNETTFCKLNMDAKLNAIIFCDLRENNKTRFPMAAFAFALTSG